MLNISADFCESKPCLNDGNCHIDRQIEPEGFRCDCAEGFTGTRCESRPESLCETQEACSSIDSCFEDLVNYRFVCICNPGFVFNGENNFCCFRIIWKCFILLIFILLNLIQELDGKDQRKRQTQTLCVNEFLTLHP